MKKKLIEVALPLAPLNVACKADEDRKTEWFAPMPVPAPRRTLNENARTLKFESSEFES
jgi:hypothetical protein